jgi:hypothetical protein
MVQENSENASRNARTAFWIGEEPAIDSQMLTWRRNEMAGNRLVLQKLSYQGG